MFLNQEALNRKINYDCKYMPERVKKDITYRYSILNLVHNRGYHLSEQQRKIQLDNRPINARYNALNNGFPSVFGAINQLQQTNTNLQYPKPVLAAQYQKYQNLLNIVYQNVIQNKIGQTVTIFDMSKNSYQGNIPIINMGPLINNYIKSIVNNNKYFVFYNDNKNNELLEELQKLSISSISDSGILNVFMSENTTQAPIGNVPQVPLNQQQSIGKQVGDKLKENILRIGAYINQLDKLQQNKLKNRLDREQKSFSRTVLIDLFFDKDKFQKTETNYIEFIDKEIEDFKKHSSEKEINKEEELSEELIRDLIEQEHSEETPIDISLPKSKKELEKIKEEKKKDKILEVLEENEKKSKLKEKIKKIAKFVEDYEKSEKIGEIANFAEDYEESEKIGEIRKTFLSETEKKISDFKELRKYILSAEKKNKSDLSSYNPVRKKYWQSLEKMKKDYGEINERAEQIKYIEELIKIYKKNIDNAKKQKSIESTTYKSYVDFSMAIIDFLKSINFETEFVNI